MAVPNLLTINVDVAEPRLIRDRAVALVNGRDWDMLFSFNTLLDVVSSTGMILPLCYNPAFYQQADAVNWKRLGLTDFVFPTPAAWVADNGFKFQGDTYIVGQGVNEKVYTSLAYPANASWYISYQNYNAGNSSNAIALEFGQGEGTTADIRFRVYTDGKVEVWKNGFQQAEGNITKLDVTLPVRAGPLPLGKENYKYNASPTQQAANSTVDIVVIPCRHNSILVLSNMGGGFLAKFDDIDPGDTAPVIIGGAKLWHYMPMTQPKLQVVPLLFGMAGYTYTLVSDVLTFSRPILHTEAAPTITPYWDSAYSVGVEAVTGAVMEVDGVTPFKADDSKTQFRLALTLTATDSRFTPFVYGASVVYPGQIVNTAGPQTNMDPYWMSVELSVPEAPDGVMTNITLRRPDAIEADTNASQIKDTTNRPFECRLTTAADLSTGPIVIRGAWKDPTWRDAISDDMAEVLLEGRDRFEVFKNYRFRDPIPYNDMWFTDAWQDIARAPGFGATDMAIESYISNHPDAGGTNFQLPGVDAPSKGEWTLLPEVGSTSEEWLHRLWETFAQNLWYHWVPNIAGPQFRLYDPTHNDDPATADPAVMADLITLYETDAAAISAGLPDGAWTYWYRNYTQKKIPPGANDVWVTGLDRTKYIPISAHYADYVSQDPTLGPSVRPNNWIGEIWRYGLVDAAINSYALAYYTISLIAPRLTKARWMGQWDCEFLIKPSGAPAWRGDYVRLNGLGRFRICTIRGLFKEEIWSPAPWDPNPTNPTDFRQYPHREFTYTGEYVSA